MSKITYLNDYKIIKKITESDKSNEQDDDLMYLGSHSYSSMPGMSWRTEFWIKVSDDQKTYSLYCTDEEADNPDEINLYDIFNANDLLAYFEGIGFDLSDDDLKLLKIK